MCGLAGIVIEEKKRTESEMSEIQNLTGELLSAAQVRGAHASGMAIVDRDGAYLIHKRPMAAKVMVRTKEFNEAVDLIDKSTGAVICHTRYATQGSPKVNRNNHPIRTGTVIGTHNGWVSNDDELFAKYDLKRFAEVDSEVLFRMIEKSETPETFFDDMLKNVSGKVSMVWADVEKPEYVYIFKGNNPLEMVYIRRLGIIAYASTWEILIDALKWSGIGNGFERMEMKRWSVTRINTKTFKMKKTNDVKIRIPKPVSYHYGSNWNSGLHTRSIPFSAKSKKTANKGKYDGTIAGFVPRYTHQDTLATDGSVVKTVNFDKKKGSK